MQSTKGDMAKEMHKLFHKDLDTATEGSLISRHPESGRVTFSDATETADNQLLDDDI
jgi:hypothetical protein